MLQSFKKSPAKAKAATRSGARTTTDDEQNADDNPQLSTDDAGTSKPEATASVSQGRRSIDGDVNILSDADEEFLLRVASEGEPPPLPPRPSSSARPVIEGPSPKDDASPSETSRANEARRWAESWLDWGMQPIRPASDLAMKKYQELYDAGKASKTRRQKSQDRRQAADTIRLAADEVREGRIKSDAAEKIALSDEDEAQKETKEMSSILARLDLSAINNRAVGISKETQKLLESFNQILKDIVNGVPTAYHDLESLLTQRQAQLEKLYGGLPPFLQTLVKTIPVKVYAFLAPQLAAAMAVEQKDEADGKDGAPKKDGSSGGKGKKRKFAMPTLKSLIGQKGAVAAMLRSIIGFLELRFPALLAGTNVIVSLAVFILLFVFWYCHKRGREERLAKSQEDSSTNVSDDDEIENANADDQSLNKLQEGVDLEKAQDEQQQLAGSRPKFQGQDTTIEKDVDGLMEKLARP